MSEPCRRGSSFHSACGTPIAGCGCARIEPVRARTGADAGHEADAPLDQLLRRLREAFDHKTSNGADSPADDLPASRRRPQPAVRADLPPQSRFQAPDYLAHAEFGASGTRRIDRVVQSPLHDARGCVDRRRACQVMSYLRLYKCSALNTSRPLSRNECAGSASDPVTNSNEVYPTESRYSAASLLNRRRERGGTFDRRIVRPYGTSVTTTAEQGAFPIAR